MKPIEPTTGMERVVSTLLGKAAETLTSTLVDHLVPGGARPRPAKGRGGRRPSAGARPRRRSASVKGGVRHG